MYTNQILTLLSKKGIILVSSINISHITAKEKYIDIHLSDSSILEILIPMKKITEKLDPKYFFRCHKSHLINLYHIKNINHQFSEVFINSTEGIPISRYRKRDFKIALAQLSNYNSSNNA